MPLKTLLQHPLFLVLLIAAGFVFPACGSKGTVKSQNTSETVLNAESTPSSNGMSDIGIPGENTPVHTYVEKIRHRRASKTSPSLTAQTNTTAAAPTPAMALQNIPIKTPTMETASPLKANGGSHWFLWVLVVLILGGIGWYFWSKKQSEGSHYPGQPKPPVGGVSPVSGFMAVKDRIADDSDKPSFWSKKLF